MDARDDVDATQSRESDADASDADPSDADVSDADVNDAGDLVQASLVALGSTEACAVIHAGPGSAKNQTVRCWGSNGAGELGRDPSKVAFSSTPLPVPAPASGGGDFSGLGEAPGDLALSAGYACAVAAGYLYCWANVPSDSRVRPELGGATYQPSLMDLDHTRLDSVTTASVGAGGGCCTRSDQSLVCWGTFAPEGMDGGFVPVDGGIAIASAFERVVVGRAHACGIAIRDGVRAVECWGDNPHGQVGIALSGHMSTPTPVALVVPAAGILSIAAGETTLARCSAMGRSTAGEPTSTGKLATRSVKARTWSLRRA